MTDSDKTISREEVERRRVLLAELHDRAMHRAKTRRALLKGAAATGAAVILGSKALGATAQDATPASPAAGGGTVHGGTPVALGRGPRGNYTLDATQLFHNYQMSTDPSSFDFNANLYCNAEPEAWAGLLTFDPDGNTVPDWAETWETNADGSVWTFHLRKDNKGWSNGDPVTAHDFVWSFTRLLSPTPAGAAAQNVYNFILFDIKNAQGFSNGESVAALGRVPTEDDLGLKALDDWTLEVTLEGPRANFDKKVGYTACVPAYRPNVEKYGDKWALGEVAPIVSNGPFKVDQWTKGVQITFSRNDGYWNAGNITLTNTIDPIIPGANLVTNYLSGTGDQSLDYTPVSGADLPQFQNAPELAKQIGPFSYPGIWMLIPSNGIPPFDQLPVRQALSHAVDRDRLVQVTNGLLQPAYCMVPPGIFGYFDDPTISAIQAFDPEKAMAALKGTDFEGGKNWPDITILMRGDEEQYNSNIMINDIVAQLQTNIGMTCKIQSLTEQPFRAELYKNTAQVVWIRWWYDYPDADNGYFDMYYGAKPSNKRQKWENADFDKLAVQAKSELDPDKRLALYKQCETIIQNDVGYIPVGYRVDFNAFKPWVQSIPMNSLGQHLPNGNIFVRAQSSFQISGRPS